MDKIRTLQESKLIEHHTSLYEYQETDFRNSNLRKLVLKYARGANALEIGCGTGHLSLDLLKRDFSVVAIDILPEMVEFAKLTTKRYQQQIQILNLKAEEIHKLKSQKFDLVVCVDVLEHIQSDIQVLRKIHDILKEEGRLLLVVPALKFLYGIRDREIGHFRRYSRTEIQQKMTQCEFIIKKTRYWNAIGILPYLISEKVFRQQINETIRHSRRNQFASILNFLLSKWFAFFENHFHVGLGLSLFVVAQKSNGLSDQG